jgi:pimeloyl-ACP methyl ester carboxylesterase
VVRPNKPLNLEPYSAPYLTNDQALARLVNSDPMVNRKMTPAELVKVDVMDDRAINGAKDLHPDYPILIIAGADDAMFKSVDLPKEVQKWGTKNATVTLLPGKGHLLMEHQHVNPQISLLIDSWLAHHTSSVTLVTAPGQLPPGAAKPISHKKRNRKQSNRANG